MADATKPTSLNIKQVFRDPGSVYATPETLLLHESLSSREKIRILRCWEYDARENDVALEEGMPGTENDLLRRILLALDELTGGENVEHVCCSKQHGNPRPDLKVE